MKKSGSLPSGEDLIKRIQEITNYSVEVIEKTISENPDFYQSGSGDEDAEFMSHYLSCAEAGEDHAEFEALTRRIFSLMGFKTEKKRTEKASHPREIDGLILNDEACLSGLLECKSGAKYTFPVGDCDKMKHTYIKNFKSKRICGRTYSLDFFVYVVGKEASGLDNLLEIAQDTGIRGSAIYARDLFRLYVLFASGKVNAIRIWNLFKKNRLLTWVDIDSIVS